MPKASSNKIKQGIAPCRGRGDGFASDDFFLMRDEAIPFAKLFPHMGQVEYCPVSFGTEERAAAYL